MTAATTVTKRSATIWIAAGLIAGLALAIALSAYQGVRAGRACDGDRSHRARQDRGHFRTGHEPLRRGSLDPRLRLYPRAIEDGAPRSGLPGCTLRHQRLSLGQRRCNCDPGRYRDGAGSVWPLIVNDDGAFATKWRLGRFTRRERGYRASWRACGPWTRPPTAFLASAPIALCDLTRNEDLEEGAEPA